MPTDVFERTGGGAPPRGRVLLLDDEPQVLHAYCRILQRAGFTVDAMHDGRHVGERLAAASFDVVISDINMPGADGIDVLRAVRALDRDLPVVLMTARGDMSTALGALEHGAMRYLLKPIDPAMLTRAAEDGVAARSEARVRAAALSVYAQAGRAESERHDLSARLERALATLHMAYQPLVSWSEKRVVAYEALLRSGEASLARPDQVLAAAEALDRVHDIGRRVRQSVAGAVGRLPSDIVVFVNLHPRDLDDPDLVDPSAPLTQVATRVVLEVTERESLKGFGDIGGHARALRELGFRLAVDDFGSGYGGLGSLVQLRPEIVKVDMGLVRGVASDSTKRTACVSTAALCTELGMLVVAEGVETEAERDALVAAGYDIMQGYLFAKPGPPFPTVDFAP